MLADEVKSGKVEFKVIDGLTIENRIAAGKAIPDDVLEELKQCPVILKGPTTTPRAGDKVNIESANVAMRKELDLFANVRPVRIPDEMCIRDRARAHSIAAVVSFLVSLFIKKPPVRVNLILHFAAKYKNNRKEVSH